MSVSLDVTCPDCRAVVTAEPADVVDRDSGLKGAVTRCTRCGHDIDVYYY